MKIHIILLICFIQFFFLHDGWGQMPCNTDYSNWKWEDQNQENWIVQNEGRKFIINPPFDPATNRTGLMQAVFRKSDYTTSKGWRLVRASFCPDILYPYFVLYNKYRAIIRVFIYISGDQAFSHAVMTCAFRQDSKKPALLSMANPIMLAPDHYWNGNVNDMLVNVIPNGATARHWHAADFSILFDPNIQNHYYAGAEMEFKFYGVDNYQIDLSGKGASSTDKSLIINNSFIFAGNAKAIEGSGNKLDASNSKLLTAVETAGGISNALTKIKDSDPKFLTDLKEDLLKTRLGTLIKNVSKFYPEIGAAASVFNFFFGQGEQASVTYQVLKLKGTMDIFRSLGGFTIKVPGALQVPGEVYGDLYYDCPMGLINLRKTPAIEVTEQYRIAHSPGSGVVSGYSGKFVKYRFNQDIEMVINQFPEVQLLDLKFAMLCKPKKDQKGKDYYKITDEIIATEEFYVEGIPVPLGWKKPNPVYHDLNRGRFIVHKYNPDDDPEKHEIYFGSPYLDKNCLKGITFELPAETEVCLGVYALFKVEGMDDPVVFHAKYMLNYSTPVPARDVFFYEEQPIFPLASYYKLPNTKISLSFPQFFGGHYIAETIIMKPGFYAKGLSSRFGPDFSFQATGAPANVCEGNTSIEPVAFNCHSSLRMATLKQVTDAPITEDASILTLSPNPTLHTTYITSSEEVIRVGASDLLGRAVPVSLQTSANKTQVDCSRLKPGIYVLTIVTSRGTQVKRIVKK